MTQQDPTTAAPGVRHWTAGWQPAGHGPERETSRAGGRILLFAVEGDIESAVREAAAAADPATDVDVVRSPGQLVAAIERGPVPHRILLHRGPAAVPGGPEAAEEEFFLLFRLTRALLARRPEHEIRLVHAHVERDGETRPECAAAGAFSRVVGLEKPAFRFRTVSVVRRPGAGLRAEAEELLAEFARPDGEAEVRHDGGQRWVRRLRPLSAPPVSAAPVPVRAGGVYLITGGLGGLGLLFARELARPTPVTLLLTGRRPLDADARAALAELERTGAQIRYVQADVSTPDGAVTAVREARAAGPLAGVIHSAGVVRDSLLPRKSAEEAAEVLAAKVRGTLLLDEALGEEPLDFFVLFSSLAGTLGNVGQADYAFANAYLDHWARRREDARRRGLRRGRTVALAWPLWDEGAMRGDAGHARAELGLHPLATPEGVRAFHTALALDEPHVVVIKGEQRTWDLLASPLPQPAPVAVDPAPGADEDPRLRARTRAHLVDLVARYTKLPTADIRTDVSFGRYGIESIMVIAMTEELESELGQLSKTLFFEYDGIDELTGHLLRVKAAELRARFGLSAAAPAAGRGHDATRDGDSPRPEGPVAAPPPSVPGRLSGKWDLLAARSRGIRPAVPTASATTAPAPAPPVTAPAPPVTATAPPVTETAPATASAPPQPSSDTDDIAVIGIAGRYPQAADLDAFWQNLRTGTDSVTEIPARRWDHTPYFDEAKAKPGKSYSRWGGFLDGIELFDPLFFNIAPAEAEFLDPQERLFLETTWQAVEDAGYARRSLAGKKVGVFAGVMFGQYQLLSTDRHGGRLHGNSSYASVANRVSYVFDFHGPSMTIDTMCSSSLVAVHQACASIRSGESELALAGGVNVMVHPSKYVGLSQGTFLSSDGRCRSFGAGGDGYVPGEGVGVVLLKPLSRAVADGDHVHAVIKGSAVNAGGRTSGYSVPNPHAQSELITEALEQAGVDPRTISYVEAHGTGTALGDPIEITGLSKAYRRYTADRQFCAIGSVKSNIGHLESAAGIAALTKVILQMRHRQLVPSLHADPPNPLIDFADSPFTVQRELRDWERPTGPDGAGLPRRAAISAFGAGGTNAHLIVEESVERDTALRPDPAEGEEQVFLLSAQTGDALVAQARRLAGFLDRCTGAAAAAATRTGDEVLGQVRAALADILGVGRDEIDPDEPYADHGLDAYGLVLLHERLRAQVWPDLPQDLIVQEPTVARTAARIAGALGLPGTPDAGSAPASGAPCAADLAFTLQTGREPMAERLAVTATGLEGLRSGLLAFLDGRDMPGVRRGSAEEDDHRLHPLLHHEVTRTYTRGLLDGRRLDEAAELWVMGADVDWAALWAGKRPRRVSLPSYPFAREAHWIVQVTADGPLFPGETQPGPAAVPPAPAALPAARETPAAEERSTSGYDVVLADLKRSFGAVLKIPEARLRPRTPFEDYGIDSVRIAQLNRVLEETYGSLPTSLLFTYKDLDALARHLSATHADRAPRPAVHETPTVTEPVPVPADSERAPAPANGADIAVIGVSGRYPKAATLREFEANLAAGRDCITEIPAERWDHRDYPDIACRWGGFLDDALTFDPSFFALSPNAAAYMDPQERLFVQSVWHCIEDAGYTPESLSDPEAGDRRGNVAVYAGVSFNEYGLYGAADLAAGQDVPIDAQLYSVANRISYLLNLRGPSLVVDTACSSSLYAIHLACQALRHGDCDLAIAGGVNLSLHPSKYLTLDMFNFLAPDGHCKSFADGGNGYVPGEGVGAVLLKPLARAIADGDHIHGVIKGSAVNHGGKTNGYTVPNPVAQTEVVKAALEQAGVGADSISYLEAHGTGTSLGDTIEVEALSAAFDGVPSAGAHCAVGSVKSNIGHLEAAAGVSQLTKVLLQMRSKRLFPSRLNADRVNPEIDFSRTPFRVQLEEASWQPARRADDGTPYPRRAGISSFGVGGVNVHMVLEEYTPQPRHTRAVDSGPHLLPLSARTPEALLRHVSGLRDFLRQDALPGLADMAFTLQTGRRALPHRVAFVAAGHGELAQQVEAFLTAQGRDAAGPGVFAGDTRSDSGPEDADPAASAGRPQDRDRLGDVARRWVRGADIAFGAWYERQPGQRVPLPGYPFEKETYWLYRAPVRAAATLSPQPESQESREPQETRETQETQEAPEALESAESSPAQEARPEADPAGAPEAGGRGPDPAFMLRLADELPDERLDLMTEFVQLRVADQLGFTEDRLPETDRGFFDLGMDSITATRTHNLLEKLFGQELDLQLFFNYPTIRDVAEYILGLLDVDSYEPPVNPAPRTAAEPLSADAADRNGLPGTDGEEETRTWLLTREWSESPEQSSTAGNPVTGRTVVLFDTTETLRSALTALPADARPGRVVLVRPGTGFRELDEDHYELAPADRADYGKLFAALAGRGVDVDGVIHFWSEAGSEPERIATALERGVYALTALSQAALDGLPARPPRMLYAFANQSGAAAPENRGVGGFVRAARMENPKLLYKTVEFTRSNLSRERMAQALMAEFARPDQEIEVRHDGRQRLVRTCRPVTADAIGSARPRFTTGGVYLVTGGLGGLAELVTRRLCGEHRAKVVLVGRGEADTEATRRLRSFGRHGAEAVYLRADVGDRDAVTALVTEVKSRHGRIDGVVHAAGVLRDGSLPAKRPQEMADVFRAKVFGTRHLDEALRDEPLECFVLFSSLAGVLGNFGQSDTCFASSYLDAFAEYRERQRERGARHGRTVSVDWSFWRDGKLRADESVLTFMRGRLGIGLLEEQEGWQALRTATGLADPQVIAVKGVLEKIARVLGVTGPDIGRALPVPPADDVPATEDDTVRVQGDQDGMDALDAADVTGASDGSDATGAVDDLAALDAMDEDDLVALLEKEMELSMNAEDGVA
ncbi:SDR family NAD(P)-dependent oxidoreductase [Streptomyces mutabilis]|uniref:SDR family NAD(P)-dependent oxidoreductase n=1 Tax=Streptomyces mutabilis TaxID=67332 RepID=UPI001783C6EA|nr:SDR family NAD(P)-dependent oxidoreductase [Streptomyces mutabilis]